MKEGAWMRDILRGRMKEGEQRDEKNSTKKGMLVIERGIQSIIRWNNKEERWRESMEMTHEKGRLERLWVSKRDGGKERVWMSELEWKRDWKRERMN